jgi:chromosome segregation ATPase
MSANDAGSSFNAGGNTGDPRGSSPGSNLPDVPAPAAASAAATTPPTTTGTTTSADAQGSLSTVALEAIEQRYVEVLRALSAEPQLEPFRAEYEKLHRLLLSSHDGEQRLLRQARELREELDTHQQKIQAAMQLSQEDDEAIRVLRTEIEAAWAKADAAHEQEQRSRELVSALRQQVTELDALVERTAGLSMGQEAYLRDLLAVKKDREEEAVTLSATLHRTAAEHQHATVLLREADKVFEAASHELEVQRSAYQQLLTNLETEQRERASKEANVRQYRETTELCVRQLEEHNGRVDNVVRDEKRVGREVESVAQEVQSLTRQLQEKQDRFAAEAARLAAAEQDNAILSNEIPQRQAALREHEEALKREQKKLSRIERSARAQQTDLSALVDKRAAAAEAVQRRTAAVEAVVAQLAQEDKEQRVLEEAVAKAMQRKSSMLAVNASQAAARAQVEGKRVMEVGNRRRLEQQMEQLRSENEALRKSIYYAEQHREKDMKAAQTALLSYHRTVDAIRLRRSEAKLIEEDIAHHQKKLKAQQELLNTVTADRQRTEKTLRETEDELKQLQQRHAAKQDELEGVKTDLIQQEAELCQLHSLARQLSKDVANTEQRLRFLREDRQHAESRVEALRSEALQLRQVIANCDLEAQQQAARLTVMTRERNALAAQLLHRTEELDALREKMQLTDAARALGEGRYGHVLVQLQTAREGLVEQRLRCRLALVRLRYLDRLHKKELVQEKLLTQSRARVRALADELSTKHNMHTWRSLEGNAPEILDGLAKVQLLQTRLMRKRDELQARVSQVEAAEQEYQRLRQQLARLPGPEAAEEIALCSENVQQRKTQLEDMTLSLAKAEEEAEQLELQVDQLQAQLQDTKRRYYQEKSKHDALRQEERTRAQTWGGAAVAAAAKGQRLSLTSRRRDLKKANNDHGASALAPSARGTTTDDFNPRVTNTLPATSTFLALSTSAVAAEGPSASADISAESGISINSSAGGTHRDTHARSSSRANSQRRGGGGAAISSGGPLLTAGPPQPAFPLQKPPHQRQFIGGGFSLTR